MWVGRLVLSGQLYHHYRCSDGWLSYGKYVFITFFIYNRLTPAPAWSWSGLRLFTSVSVDRVSVGPRGCCCCCLRRRCCCLDSLRPGDITDYILLWYANIQMGNITKMGILLKWAFYWNRALYYIIYNII